MSTKHILLLVIKSNVLTSAWMWGTDNQGPGDYAWIIAPRARGTRRSRKRAARARYRAPHEWQQLRWSFLEWVSLTERIVYELFVIVVCGVPAAGLAGV